MTQDTRDRIEAARFVAIVRGNYLGAMRAMAEALLAGGIRVIEVTMNSAGVLDAIRMIAQEFGDRVLVGAGTVVEPEQVKQVAQAGARFIVSPDTYRPVVQAALDLGLEPMPGAFTATEVLQAHRAGARLVKLFPATAGGPDYLKQLRAPLDMIHFVPTGGIDASNVRAYFEAGAVAVGVGGALVRNNFDGSPAAVAELTERARRLVAAAQSVPSLSV